MEAGRPPPWRRRRPPPPFPASPRLTDECRKEGLGLTADEEDPVEDMRVPAPRGEGSERIWG